MAEKTTEKTEESGKKKPKTTRQKQRQRRLMMFFIILAVLGLASAIGYTIFFRYLNAIPNTQVPEVVGLAENDAIFVLQQHKLEAYAMGKRFSEDTSPNTVLETIPESGRTVKEGRKIGYVLSKGHDLSYVPDLKGISLTQADSLLSDQSLTLVQIGEFHSLDFRPGIIVSQNPKAGEYVTKNSTIFVSVSKGFPVSIGVSRIEFGYDRLMVTINLKVMYGQSDKKTNVKIISVTNEEPFILYNDDIPSGKELYFEFEEPIGNRIEIYYNDILAKSKKVLF